IHIELNGSRPLLATGLAVSVELSGLTIVVRYPPSGARPSPAPPPVIRAAGAAIKIERCAFEVAGPTRFQGSRAIVAEGGSLVVDRCWFLGFDRAIELDAYNGTIARIQQTMIVSAPGPPPAPAPAPEMHGWSVK